MTKGSFIVVEGGEGAGKSSQLALLATSCNNLYITREPGGSPYAEEIRSIILDSEYASVADVRTHFALFWAARADHVYTTIAPTLASGQDLISDRFDASTYAYQIYGQEAWDLEELFFTLRDFYLETQTPDLYIYLDIDPEEGLKRRSEALGKNNHFDDRDIAFHTRMREGYQKFFNTINGTSEIIDATRSFEKVAHDIQDIITQHCNISYNV